MKYYGVTIRVDKKIIFVLISRGRPATAHNKWWRVGVTGAVRVAGATVGTACVVRKFKRVDQGRRRLEFFFLSHFPLQDDTYNARQNTYQYF